MRRTLGLIGGGILGIALVVVACQDKLLAPAGDQSGPGAISAEIFDGAHGEGGNPDFFFLPPLQPSPRRNPKFDAGGFDATLSPVVKICDGRDLTPAGECAVSQVKNGQPVVFTAVRGWDGLPDWVDPEQYHVLWTTKDYDLVVGHPYRILVKVGSRLLGFLDVVPSNKLLGALRITAGGQDVGWLDDWVVPIRFRIEVGATADHLQETEGFYFLPPLVRPSTYSGTFDGAVSPVVEICEWAANACVVPMLAVFTTTTGPGSETVRVVPEDELYIVDWHTNQFAVDPGMIYRIWVRVGPRDLGFADVRIIEPGRARNLQTGEDVLLRDGATLPIRFRIETGTLPVGDALAAFDPTAVVTDAGGSELVVNQLLVVFSDGISDASAVDLIRSVGGNIVGFLQSPPAYHLEFPFVSSVSQLAPIVRSFRASPAVSAVVTGYFLPSFALADLDGLRAQDPVKAWAYTRIHLDEAWTAIKSAGVPLHHVSIALIDPGGVYTQHPEFSSGPVDFFGEELDCSAPWTWLELKDAGAGKASEHVTVIAGIIGGRDENGGALGMLGPADVSEYQVRFYKEGCQNVSDNAQVAWYLYLALKRALEHQPNVISMSTGLPLEDPSFTTPGRKTLASLINTKVLEELGTVVVVSAGNTGEDEFRWWPEVIDAPNFVRVGATDRFDHRAVWSPSDFGGEPCRDHYHDPTATDCSSNGGTRMLAAPGSEVWAPEANGPDAYAAFLGTSVAAPFVAGTAALVRMVAQQSMTGATIVGFLESSADWIPVILSDNKTGNWGVVDACEAVAAANSSIKCPAVHSVAITPPATTLHVGDNLLLTATPQDRQGNALLDREVTWGSSDESVATVVDGLVTAVGAGQATISASSEGVTGTAAISVTSTATLGPAGWRTLLGEPVTRARAFERVEFVVQCGTSPASTCASRTVYVSIRIRASGGLYQERLVHFGPNGEAAADTIRVPPLTAMIGYGGLVYNASMNGFDELPIVRSTELDILLQSIITAPQWVDGVGVPITETREGETAYASVACDGDPRICADLPVHFEILDWGRGGIVLQSGTASFSPDGLSATLSFPFVVPNGASSIVFRADLHSDILPIASNTITVYPTSGAALANPRWTDAGGYELQAVTGGQTLYARVDCATTPAVCAGLPVYISVLNSVSGGILAGLVGTFPTDGSGTAIAEFVAPSGALGMRFNASLGGFDIAPIVQSNVVSIMP